MYSVSDTTGENISKIIRDALCRLNLPIDNLRGQAYDGAANMAGRYNGAQAKIKELQPLAMFVHCHGHISNLVAAAAATSSAVVCSALDAVNELGVLLSNSGKLKAELKQAEDLSANPIFSKRIRPLCPTRWLVRVNTVTSTKDNIKNILMALENYKKCNISANGVYDRLTKGTTILGIFIVIKVFTPLEKLNTSLQGKKQTVAGARKAARIVLCSLKDMRTDSVFSALYKEATEFIVQHDLDPIQQPRKRQPPKRLTGDALPFHADNVQEYYKLQFFELLDTTINQLDSRFFNDSLLEYASLEKLLLEGGQPTILKKYNEFDTRMLKMQLEMFRAQYTYSSLQEASDEMMSFEVRNLFQQVELLVRLLLTVPASSCEAERSFSALRRLKTYLRSTMTQQRLNSVCVCHVHKHKLDRTPLTGTKF